MTETGGGRGSGRSMLVAWYNDDDEPIIIMNVPDWIEYTAYVRHLIGLVSVFNGIFTFVGYLTSIPCRRTAGMLFNLELGR